MQLDIQAINEKIHQESAFVDKVTAEVGKVIVGQSTCWIGSGAAVAHSDSVSPSAASTAQRSTTRPNTHR